MTIEEKIAKLEKGLKGGRLTEAQTKTFKAELAKAKESLKPAKPAKKTVKKKAPAKKINEVFSNEVLKRADLIYGRQSEQQIKDQLSLYKNEEGYMVDVDQIVTAYLPEDKFSDGSPKYSLSQIRGMVHHVYGEKLPSKMYHKSDEKTNRPKNLSEWKKWLKENKGGDIFVGTLRGIKQGNSVPDPHTARTITSPQSNSLGTTINSTDKESWIDFGKASDWVFTNEYAAFVDDYVVLAYFYKRITGEEYVRIMRKLAGMIVGEAGKSSVALDPKKPVVAIKQKIKPESTTADKKIADCKKALQEADYTVKKVKTASGKTKVIKTKRPERAIVITKTESLMKTVTKDIPKENKENVQFMKTIDGIASKLKEVLVKLDKLAKSGDEEKLNKIYELLKGI